MSSWIRSKLLFFLSRVRSISVSKTGSGDSVALALNLMEPSCLFFGPMLGYVTDLLCFDRELFLELANTLE